MTVRRRRDKRIWYVLTIAFVAVGFFSFLTQREEKAEVEAASLDAFDAGYIISDYQMKNYQSMTEAKIQEFLTKKNGCKNTDVGLYNELSGKYSTIHWHFSGGHFVCLSEELFGDGIKYGEDLSAGEGETAAHIIWQAAQDYKINPQVLIVLLEKEQGLITDPYPHSGQYRSATGYGCPDTAPCNEKYYGFKNQVRKAAELFKAVLDGGWTNYPLGQNYIQYNPSASCGGSMVNVRNLATSALYRYTPYQPNAAALAAGYGTDECGAYGNRNFYLYFQDWFGGIMEEGSAVAENDGQIIEDGVYRIESKGTNKVIDIEGGVYSGMNSGEILLFRNKEKISQITNQSFKIQYNKETGYYNIINPETGLLLDVFNADEENGTPVIVWRANGGCNQDWLFARDGDGYYSILSRCSKKVLTATADFDAVIQNDNSDKRQKWKLVPVQAEDSVVKIGEYQFITENNLAVDIYGGIKDGMTMGRIVTYEAKQDGDETIGNQKFSLEFDKNTQNYVIKNKKSGLVLLEKEGRLIVGASNNDCSSRWVFYRVSDEYYKIFSACGKVVGEFDVETSIPAELSTRIAGGIKLKIKGLDRSIDGNASYKIMKDDAVVDIYGGIIPDMVVGSLIKYRNKSDGYDNQIFKFKYNVETDSYYIYNPATNMYVDVAEEKNDDDSEVIVFRFNGNCNQQWLIEKKEKGYLITSVCSRKNLNFSANNKKDEYPKLVISGDKSFFSLVKL